MFIFYRLSVRYCRTILTHEATRYIIGETMKKLINIALLFSLAGFCAVSNANTTTLFSEKGYPYKDLIQRTESVKIIYTEDNQEVTCKVAVTSHDHNWQSNTKTVNHKAFEQAPLASCLTREEAKNLLAQTYNS